MSTPSISRKASLADFLIEEDVKKYNKTHSHNDNIAKNQQEFGHRKRIKP